MSFSIPFDPAKKGPQTGQIPDIDGDGLPENVFFEIDEKKNLKSGYIHLSSQTPFDKITSLMPTSGLTVRRGAFYKGDEVHGRKIPVLVESFELAINLMARDYAAVTINAVVRSYLPKPQALSKEQIKMDIENLVPDILLSQSSSAAEGEEIKKWILERYGVAVEIIDQRRVIQNKIVAPFFGPNLVEKLQQLKKTIEKIPPNFLRTLHVEKLALCGDILRVDTNGKEIHDAVGMSDLASGTIYLEAIWSFYHELFHVLDSQHHGLRSSDPYQSTLANRQNDAWLSLDPQYKAVSDQLHHAFAQDDRDSGAIKALQEKLYKIKVDPDEEQAEYSRILFNLDTLSMQDHYIREMEIEGVQAKMAQMKKWLYEWSGGRFDEQFWKDIANGKVNEFYWDK